MGIAGFENNPFVKLLLRFWPKKEAAEQEDSVAATSCEPQETSAQTTLKSSQELESNQAMFLEALDNFEEKLENNSEEKLAKSPEPIPVSAKQSKQSKERPKAWSGEKTTDTKVLSSEDKKAWQEKSREKDLFLDAVDKLTAPKEKDKRKPLATLGEQLDFQKLTAKVNAAEAEKAAKSAKTSKAAQADKAAKADKTAKGSQASQAGQASQEGPLGQAAPESLATSSTASELLGEAKEPIDARTAEEEADANLFLQAWDKLGAKKSEDIGDGLADLPRKWQKLHKNKSGKTKVKVAEDYDSKLFLRAVNKLDAKTAKPSNEKSFTTLAEQCPALKEAKPKDAPQKVWKKKAPDPFETNQEEDAKSFLKAVEGSVPLKDNRVIRPEPPEVKIRTPDQENLADLLEGKFSFEFFCRDEYFEGNIIGLDQSTIDKLRCGQFSPEAHLDLHGFVVDQAYEAVCDFIKSAWYKGLRTILLVPGRGHNSFAGVGILRSHLQTWLTHDPLKRVVVAFCTAQPCDGGPGSVYVLLRKYKKKGRMQWHSRVDDYIAF